MIDIELVYIGQHSSRFIFGSKYKVVQCTDDVSTFLDKDGTPMMISNDMVALLFQPQYKFREERIDSILS